MPKTPPHKGKPNPASGSRNTPNREIHNAFEKALQGVKDPEKGIPILNKALAELASSHGNEETLNALHEFLAEKKNWGLVRKDHVFEIIMQRIPANERPYFIVQVCRNRVAGHELKHHTHIVEYLASYVIEKFGNSGREYCAQSAAIFRQEAERYLTAKNYGRFSENMVGETMMWSTLGELEKAADAIGFHAEGEANVPGNDEMVNGLRRIERILRAGGQMPR